MTAKMLAENLTVKITTIGAMMSLLVAITYGVYDIRARLTTGEKERLELKQADVKILAALEKKRAISDKEWMRDQAGRYFHDFASINDLIETDIWNVKYDKKGEK